MLPVRTSSLLLGVKENQKSSSSIHKTRDTTSKMILRIEDFLPSENQNKNYHIKNHKKSQVISLKLLKSGLVSHEFLITKLLTIQPIGKFFIQKSNDGFLDSINIDKNTIWIRSVQFSEDIYNQNAIFELTKSNEIRLRLIKDVAENEEIIGWFSEEIAMLLSIPFLTPTNIQGNNCYKCHHCGKTFESPNPLKIHITTDCDNQSVDILWNRLNLVQKSSVVKSNLNNGDDNNDNEEEVLVIQSETTTPATIAANAIEKHFIRNELLKVPPPKIVLPTSSSLLSSSSSSSLSSSLNSSSSTLQHFYRFPHIADNFRRFSAFTPMMSSNFHHRHLSSSSLSSSSLSSSSMSSSSMLQCFSNTTKLIENQNQQFICGGPQNSVEYSSAINAAAQIETLVSNMSTSKQGHLCIYCGKIYSRKYGLKIHIRTHTGFKPLKCKYCLRPFGDPSNLNKHIRLHLQNTRNFDRHCSKTNDLRKHIKIDNLVNDHHQNSNYDRMSSSDDD